MSRRRGRISACHAIARLTADGSRREFPLPAGAGEPWGITVGTDRKIWFTEVGAGKVGRLDPTTGDLVEFPVGAGDSQPQGIVTGPDGALWGTESAANRVFRISLDGRVTEFRDPNSPECARLDRRRSRRHPVGREVLGRQAPATLDDRGCSRVRAPTGTSGSRIVVATRSGSYPPPAASSSTHCRPRTHSRSPSPRSARAHSPSSSSSETGSRRSASRAANRPAVGSA